MSNAHRLTDPAAVVEFMLAGRARLTLVSKKSGKRFTYRVAKAKKGTTRWFVTFLNGQSNETDYQYIGTVLPTFDYRHGTPAHTVVSESAPVVMAFKWFLHHLKDGRLSDSLEVWHEGRCGRCGRALTVPSSIARGIGPECAGHFPSHTPPYEGHNWLPRETLEKFAKPMADSVLEHLETLEIQRREREEEQRRMDRKFKEEL